MRQRRHAPGHLVWRGVVAAASDLLMLTGVYPFVPHAGMVWSRWRKERPSPPGQLRAAVREWGAAVALSAARPLGFLPMPGEGTRGPRPIVLVHGYAMNRANFVLLARRLAAAGLGPIYGFEYWTLGKTGAAARRLGAYVDEVLATTGAAAVDVIGHSMGGVVGRYYVTLGDGDGKVANLITIGAPHSGTLATPPATSSWTTWPRGLMSSNTALGSSTPANTKADWQRSSVSMPLSSTAIPRVSRSVPS
jgi:triacylglycerol esterase/lipase EstA (alpha/beta hydrolase family)